MKLLYVSSLSQIILFLNVVIIVGGYGGKPICLEDINADPYADKVLLKVVDVIEDPIRLPVYHKGYLLDLDDGTLTGSRDLHRSGHTVLKCTEDAFYHEIPIAINNFSADYKWTLHLFHWSKRGKMFIKGMNLMATVIIRQELRRGAEPTVHRFTIHGITKPSVTYTGIDGVVQKLAETISTTAVQIIPKIIETTLQKSIHAGLQRAVHEIFGMSH
ncbi:uncharacterized protein LOC106476257 [Limulus polyphemus]|uniref:Uncharacterized protein LOC106476257 n=1 Tax=Limulus polyphemus TaxID=6850 RepID=A0ABM1C120_LIMPO|nr:uncharacterized protein LOC106476257 [Limulus polyphemus]XP_022235887.1 uncharacterized protein LOC106476257 [Limulus polyphemus]